ncbi:MAG: hypothetical protein ACO3JL_08340 [Myxococcota bacterium]
MTEPEEMEEIQGEAVEEEPGFFEKTGATADESLESAGRAIEETVEDVTRTMAPGERPAEPAEVSEGVSAADDVAAAEEKSPQTANVDINIDFTGTAPREETILGTTPMGAMVMVGGGTMDFARAGPSDFTGTGGYWNARVAGTRTILSAEGAYIGRAQSIDAVGLSAGSTLLGNGVEGLLRLNAPFSQQGILIEPFAVAGGSWEYFTILNDGANTSSIDDNDVVVFLPVGLGVAAAWQGLSLDLRGLYRHAFLSDMFGSSGFGIDSPAMSSWQLGANVGFEF